MKTYAQLSTADKQRARRAALNDVVRELLNRERRFDSQALHERLLAAAEQAQPYPTLVVHLVLEDAEIRAEAERLADELAKGRQYRTADDPDPVSLEGPEAPR